MGIVRILIVCLLHVRIIGFIVFEICNVDGEHSVDCDKGIVVGINA